TNASIACAALMVAKSRSRVRRKALSMPKARVDLQVAPLALCATMPLVDAKMRSALATQTIPGGRLLRLIVRVGSAAWTRGTAATNAACVRRARPAIEKAINASL